MPELPEVSLSRDCIKPILINQKIINIFVGPNGRYRSSPPEKYYQFQQSLLQSDCFITNIKNRGKFMYWSFSNGWYLFNTFGMTGSWNPAQSKHVCFGFDLANQQSIYFNDPRHFGTIKFSNNRQDLTKKLKELGWDALQDPLDIKWQNYLTAQLNVNNNPIATTLLNQKIFAGVGNYIRAEALYKAKISPWRLCKQLTNQEILELLNAIVEVVNDSYNHQGATLLTYKTAYGEEGRYTSKFQVYSKLQDPFNNPIKTELTPEGRTIHWCPAIQK